VDGLIVLASAREAGDMGRTFKSLRTTVEGIGIGVIP